MSEHRAPDSPENPHAGSGAVVLDIGGDVGAIVVLMPLAMVGEEVDIVAAGSDLHGHEDGHDHGHDDGHGHGHGHGHRDHVAVVRRPLPGGGEVPCLVYPEVVEGTWWLLPKGTNTVVLEVAVEGGRVTEAEWPT